MFNPISTKTWWWMPLVGVFIFVVGSVIGYRFGQQGNSFKEIVSSTVNPADVIVHIEAPPPAELVAGGAQPVQTVIYGDSVVVREQCISVPELLAALPFPTGEGTVHIDTVYTAGDTVRVPLVVAVPTPPGDFDLTHPGGGVVATRRAYQFTRFDRSANAWRTDVYNRGIERGMTLQGGIGYDPLNRVPNAGFQLTGFTGPWALSAVGGATLNGDEITPSVSLNLQRTLWGW